MRGRTRPVGLMRRGGREGLRSGAWTPASLPSLTLWLDASRASTITVDGSNRVSAWADRRGGSNPSFVQATGANQPLYEATGFNTSYPCVYCDGAGTAKYLTSGSAITATPLVTVYAVCDIVTNVGAASSFIASANYPSAGMWMLYRANGTGGIRMMVRIGSETVGEYALASTPNARLGAVVDGGQAAASSIVAMYKDGAAQSVTASPVLSIAGSFSASTWRIGESGGFATDVRFSEVLVYAANHNATTVTQVDTYLKAKWGLP